jgi:hypothetical protein
MTGLGAGEARIRIHQMAPISPLLQQGCEGFSYASVVCKNQPTRGRFYSHSALL